MTGSIPILVAALLTGSCGGGDSEARHVKIEAPAESEPTPTIVSIDPRFEELVPSEAQVELLADGFNWLEGPVWHRGEEYLLFSDIPANSVYKWQERGQPALHLQPSGYSGMEPFAGPEPGSNGLVFDSVGRLVLCEHGDRRITRLEADGTRSVLADRYEGRRLNSPNDAVYRSNGDLYFTDPPFGLPETFDDPARELPFSGVYRLSTEGKLVLLEDRLAAPNGIGFSPDEDRLYISDVDPDRPAWWVYDVQPDGALENGRVLVSASEWVGVRPGGPDGIEVDGAGNVYGAGPGGVYVFSPDGTHLGTIELGVATGNLAWGGDGSDLYITAGSSLYRVRVAAKGAGW